ncbi:hypothetical protein [Klebsiella pneumoniae]|nr:hypothetical protein [Klebsiella pneumoniae]MDZ1369888.1 hypothetical protein [Klebsiella pneumoniae]
MPRLSDVLRRGISHWIAEKYLTINRFSRTAFLEPSPFWWYGLAFLKN